MGLLPKIRTEVLHTQTLKWYFPCLNQEWTFLFSWIIEAPFSTAKWKLHYCKMCAPFFNSKLIPSGQKYILLISSSAHDIVVQCTFWAWNLDNDWWTGSEKRLISIWKFWNNFPLDWFDFEMKNKSLVLRWKWKDPFIISKSNLFGMFTKQTRFIFHTVALLCGSLCCNHHSSWSVGTLFLFLFNFLILSCCNILMLNLVCTFS